MRLKQEAANGIVDSSNHLFGFSILLGGVKAGESEGNTLRGEVLVEFSVIVLATSITLKRFDGLVEMILNIV